MPAEELHALLLEGVNPTAIETLKAAGFNIEYHKKAQPADYLLENIHKFDLIGIRSKTLLTKEILVKAVKLRAIGCFCIGTNQVDLEQAAKQGIVVFNSPFSNSRSVAELVLAEIIALSRKLGDRNAKMHQGVYERVSRNTLDIEIRGKTLGIVGYGHIGTQLSVLADAMGMKIIFFDALSLMPLGTAKPVNSLQELLNSSDFVTLHVPEIASTRNMIGEKEFALMKPGSFFINASRGTVVDLDALAASLKSGHIAGAAVDVYPTEPFANGPGFETVLQNCPNTILTPHIGGSTEEAQVSIGSEVSGALARFFASGCTNGAYNIPEVSLPHSYGSKRIIRILNFHHNVPGVLKQINKILSDFNIEKQTCDSRGPVSYLMADLLVSEDGSQVGRDLLKELGEVVESISTRIVTL